MSTGTWALIGLGLIVMIGNVLLTGPLLTSPALTSSEKLKHALLMWLVPGSFLYVGQIVQESWAGDPRGDVPNPLLHSGDTSSEALRRKSRIHGDDTMGGSDDFDFD